MKSAIALLSLVCSTFSLPADKILFTLEKGEYIISSESQLKATIAGGGYSIVTKQGGKFFVHTEKGKAGPFDKLPAEYLPSGRLHTSDAYTFEEPDSKDGKTEMGMAANGGMTIKLDNKVIATLAPGEIPAAVVVDKIKNRMAYMAMSADKDGNLVFDITQLPSGKKIQIKDVMLVQIKKNNITGNFIYEGLTVEGQKTFYTESGEKMGPFNSEAKAFELYDNKTIVIMDPLKGQSGANIIKNGKTIHTLKYSNSDMQLLFSSDASKYLTASSGGLEFSDGTKSSNGILPTIEKTAGGANLHYLHVNENKEVIQTSMPW